MNRLMRPRLQAPARLAAGALVAIVIGGASYGWSSVADVAPIVIAVIVGLYLWGRRDSDTGALIRRELDERLEHQRLQVQALVGRVLSLAVAIAYVVAVAAKATLWPWAILVGLMAVSFFGGRFYYGERGASNDD